MGFFSVGGTIACMKEEGEVPSLNEELVVSVRSSTCCSHNPGRKWVGVACLGSRLH